jgi:hypothetical protein
MKHLVTRPHVLFSTANGLHKKPGDVEVSHEAALNVLNKLGSNNAHSIDGSYGSPEKSIFISEPNEKQLQVVKTLTDKTGQESYIHSDGFNHKMIFTNGPEKGSVKMGRGTEFHAQKPNDFFSQLPDGTTFTHKFGDTQTQKSEDEKKGKFIAPKKPVNSPQTPQQKWYKMSWKDKKAKLAQDEYNKKNPQKPLKDDIASIAQQMFGNKNLKKGVKRRLFPFNPQTHLDPEVDQTHNLRTWTTYDRDGNLMDLQELHDIRDSLPEMSPNARKRGLISLASQTKTRIHPKTGERQYLLHRGMSAQEVNATVGDTHVSHDKSSSWSPSASAASVFSDQKYMGETHLIPPTKPTKGKRISAWINESDIHHIPMQYGEIDHYGNAGQGSPEYQKEKEVIVKPHKSEKAKLPTMTPTQKLHERINYEPLPSTEEYEKKLPPSQAANRAKTRLRMKFNVDNVSHLPTKPPRGAKKLAASELAKAPIENYDSSIGRESPEHPMKERYEAKATTKEVAPGIYHHALFSNRNQEALHMLSDHQDPFYPKATVYSQLLGDAQRHNGPLTVQLSQVHPEHKGMGHGKALYTFALNHHGEIQSDELVSPQADDVYRHLESQGAKVKYGEWDTRDRHVARGPVSHSYSPKKLAASELAKAKEDKLMPASQRKQFRAERSKFEGQDPLAQDPTNKPGVSDIGVETRRADPKQPGVFSHGYARIGDAAYHNLRAKKRHVALLDRLKGMSKGLEKAELPPQKPGQVSEDGKRVAIKLEDGHPVWDYHPQIKQKLDQDTLNMARRWIKTQPEEHHPILKEFINGVLQHPLRHIRFGANSKTGGQEVRLRHVHKMVTEHPDVKLEVHSPDSLSLYAARHGQAGGVTHFQYNLKNKVAKSESVDYNGTYGIYTDSNGNSYRFSNSDGGLLSKSSGDSLGFENGLLQLGGRLEKANLTAVRGLLKSLRQHFGSRNGGNAGNAGSNGALSSNGAQLLKSAPKVNLNPEHGKKIADAYHAMKHDPNHPEVKAAYGALIDETKNQFRDMIKQGFKLSKIKSGQDNPYKTSKDLHADIEQNKHMHFFPTDQGFGGEGSAPSNHPMLQPTEFMHGGKPLLANDLFRIVHDYRGHHLGGKSTFGPKGEHQAYLTHKKDFSPLAQKALASETLMQNSWVNFGPHAEHNKKNPDKTIFADQKAAIAPDWVVNGRWHE